MRRILAALFGVTLLILVLGATPATTIFAHEDGSADKYETAVLDRRHSEVGEAELKLKDGLVTIKVKTEGLAQGHVFSIWGKINGGPAFSIYGFISEDDGEAHFHRQFEVDKDFSQLRLIIKDHGAPLSESWEIELQKTTKHYGCRGSCPSVQFATFKGL